MPAVAVVERAAGAALNAAAGVAVAVAVASSFEPLVLLPNLP